MMKTDNNQDLGRRNERRFGLHYSSASHCGHTGLLTERLDLKRALLRSLCSMHLQLRHVRSLSLIKTAIAKRSCDVAIVDLERHDIWPSLVFSEFDRIAAVFPIIMLCSEKAKALDYIQRAENTVDIFSYDVVGDPRFGSVVHAAKLRSEARELIDEGPGLKYPPLSAA